ncbi:CoA-transferase [Phaeospirillum tilakii]|uniref:CoA-transferase n=1 Tax=Phaeospirillum tilakii TaxID=741673 RepID=A0ABW5C6Z0_9PROT
MAAIELLVSALARTLAGARTIAIGTNSPIPAAAALLAQARAAAPVEVMIIGSARHWPFTDGGRELFDFAAQGRLDAFVLGGGQIDRTGAINLVRAGKARFPGSFGSAYLYPLVPRIVLFRAEHTPRVLVERVEFASARGRPAALVTGKAVFGFAEGGFTLSSVHPGETADGIRAATGFALPAAAGPVPETPPPDAEDLALLHGPIAEDLAALYPRFVAQSLRAASR